MSRCDGWIRSQHDVISTPFKLVLHAEYPDDIGGTLHLCPSCMMDVVKDLPTGRWSIERYVEPSSDERANDIPLPDRWREDMEESERRLESLRERTRAYHFTRVVADVSDVAFVRAERQRLKRAAREFLSRLVDMEEGRWYEVKITDESEPIREEEAPWKCTGYMKLDYVLTIVMQEE